MNTDDTPPPADSLEADNAARAGRMARLVRLCPDTPQSDAMIHKWNCDKTHPVKRAIEAVAYAQKLESERSALAEKFTKLYKPKYSGNPMMDSVLGTPNPEFHSWAESLSESTPSTLFTAEMVREMESHIPFSLTTPHERWQWCAEYLNQTLRNPSAICDCCNVRRNGEVTDL